ncbi:uncharacterized protein N0V89_004448 [Didymosphaeria variabile]|uniref:MFS general substrate transporter n=1 Tax=Didymosphaeria variabile TaxID=1932322 RepID=A0A9W8XPG3_9PLEO|nr:uncharacterized protein N0V89_004448 [Didymosphaeria variabile]KAJ4356415.1 hypothetical protein N0V89_004448 [Didymosphaeria variabile]
MLMRNQADNTIRRWLFIIEGVITIGVAITAAFILPDYPATTTWLSDEEKAYAQWRLVDDIGESDEGGASSIKDGVILAFKDPRLYLFTLLQHISLLSQSFQYFFPTIVKTLGYGNIETLLITAPVWIGTFLVSLVVTYTAGKYNDRSIHIFCLMLISVVGNIIVVSSLNTVYPSTDGPRYLPGGSATAAVALSVAILALVVRLVLQRDNKKLAVRDVLDNEGSVGGSGGAALGGRALGFRYVL